MLRAAVHDERQRRLNAKANLTYGPLESLRLSGDGFAEASEVQRAFNHPEGALKEVLLRMMQAIGADMSAHRINGRERTLDRFAKLRSRNGRTAGGRGNGLRAARGQCFHRTPPLGFHFLIPYRWP